MASSVAASFGSASCSSASHLPNDDDDALLVDQMGLVLPEPLVGDGAPPLVLANAQPRELSLNREPVVLSVGMSTVGGPSTIEDIPAVAPPLAAKPAAQLGFVVRGPVLACGWSFPMLGDSLVSASSRVGAVLTVALPVAARLATLV
ncbi:hypothetical protein IscW_ISCW021987 [Ixodes scapularis]|uniref:Uncharacterized protein n=1 Tax=Ixodes scapularis TaxID=6945 RepID=B7QFZ3_IXOSC|nr:hypothetical protein IscW_ISCW021987 [Ixodes scapularis]|eukprot:XP_002401056.1 hypothetical protein IscW_ISCW021987 [Ixodes scapularis]